MAKKIEPIKESTKDLGNDNNAQHWTSIFKTLNVLGTVSEAYAKTLAYKIETKRLNNELERVKLEAGIAVKAIDSVFKLKMEQLKQRREHLLSFYITVNNQLNHLHIERMTVLDLLKLVVEKTVAPNIDIEERKLYKEMAIEISSQIPNFGEKASNTLEVIAKTIPPIEIPETFGE